MNFKMNLIVRVKNPWFWVGVAGTVLAAMGVSPEMLTSWSAVRDAFVDLIRNPYMLGCVALALLGTFVDPTTSGIGDSKQALSYKKPNK